MAFCSILLRLYNKVCRCVAVARIRVGDDIQCTAVVCVVDRRGVGWKAWSMLLCSYIFVQVPHNCTLSATSPSAHGKNSRQEVHMTRSLAQPCASAVLQDEDDQVMHHTRLINARQDLHMAHRCNAHNHCCRCFWQGACTFSFGVASCSHALYSLWQDGALCDVALEAASGPALPAHRIILAASSAYFQALFIGAGAAMHGSCQPRQQQHDGRSAGEGGPALPRVKLHHFEAAPLREVVGSLYEGHVTVAADKLPWLLEMGSYLEVPPLVDACCQVGSSSSKWQARQLPLLTANSPCHSSRINVSTSIVHL